MIKKSWCLWFSYLEAQDKDILLYAALLPNDATFALNLDGDFGSMDTEVGKIFYSSKIITNDLINLFVDHIDKYATLDFSLLDPSVDKRFSVTSVRKLVGETFGQSVVPISSYYTTPDLDIWMEHLEELAKVLLLLKTELNLPFDREYARKFGNLKIHWLSKETDNAISIELLNSKRSDRGGAYIRVAKKEPLLNERQSLHVICREKKDVTFQKLFELDAGRSLFEFDELSEDSHELECWVFDGSGELIHRYHQYYTAEIGINMGFIGRQLILHDKLTEQSKRAGKEVAENAATVKRTQTERSLTSSYGPKGYHSFDSRMTSLKPILFPESNHSFWFDKSVANEVNVIKHFQSIIDNGRSRKAILVDPFFGADAFERFATRIEESKLELTILTSLGEIDADTGKKIKMDIDPVDELKKAIAKNRDLINCKLKLINISLRKTNQAFHDRYLVVYPFEGIPIVYMLSNSINKMAGNWPFCMTKIEPAVAQQIQTYIEGLCEGEDNSREENPIITFQWSNNE
jgi:hypothetical protein